MEKHARFTQGSRSRHLLARSTVSDSFQTSVFRKPIHMPHSDLPQSYAGFPNIEARNDHESERRPRIMCPADQCPFSATLGFASQPLLSMHIRKHHAKLAELPQGARGPNRKRTAHLGDQGPEQSKKSHVATSLELENFIAGFQGEFQSLGEVEVEQWPKYLRTDDLLRSHSIQWPESIDSREKEQYAQYLSRLWSTLDRSDTSWQRYNRYLELISRRLILIRQNIPERQQDAVSVSAGDPVSVSVVDAPSDSPDSTQCTFGGVAMTPEGGFNPVIPIFDTVLSRKEEDDTFGVGTNPLFSKSFDARFETARSPPVDKLSSDAERGSLRLQRDLTPIAADFRDSIIINDIDVWAQANLYNIARSEHEMPWHVEALGTRQAPTPDYHLPLSAQEPPNVARPKLPIPRLPTQTQQ